MGSEWQSPASSSYVANVRRLVEARHAWEAANPEIAAAWSEALREDHDRAVRLEVESKRVDLRERAFGVLEAAGVPRDALRALRVLREEPPIKTAREFMAAPTDAVRFLLLFGKKGTGKTVAAAYVLRETYARFGGNDAPGGTEARRPPLVAFVLASTFGRMSGYAHDDKAWFEELCAVRTLVLDDFGAEHMTPFGSSMLDELLTRRHGNLLRTVITTNLDRTVFEARVGERLWDRIRTSVTGYVAKGESMRKRATP